MECSQYEVHSCSDEDNLSFCTDSPRPTANFGLYEMDVSNLWMKLKRADDDKTFMTIAATFWSLGSGFMVASSNRARLSIEQHTYTYIADIYMALYREQ